MIYLGHMFGPFPVYLWPISDLFLANFWPISDLFLAYFRSIPDADSGDTLHGDGEARPHRECDYPTRVLSSILSAYRKGETVLALHDGHSLNCSKDSAWLAVVN